MDTHSDWDEVRAKRRPPSEEVRASIESELVRDERSAAGDDLDPDRSGSSDGDH